MFWLLMKRRSCRYRSNSLDKKKRREPQVADTGPSFLNRIEREDGYHQDEEKNSESIYLRQGGRQEEHPKKKKEVRHAAAVFQQCEYSRGRALTIYYSSTEPLQIFLQPRI